MKTRTSLIHRAIWESIVARPDNEIISTSNWFQITTPGRPAPHMNGIYRCERSDLNQDEIQRLVSEVIAHYKTRNSNFRWKTSSETRPHDLGKVLIENGMVLKDLQFGFCVPPTVRGIYS